MYKTVIYEYNAGVNNTIKVCTVVFAEDLSHFIYQQGVNFSCTCGVQVSVNRYYTRMVSVVFDVCCLHVPESSTGDYLCTYDFYYER